MNMTSKCSRIKFIRGMRDFRFAVSKTKGEREMVRAIRRMRKRETETDASIRSTSSPGFNPRASSYTRLQFLVSRLPFLLFEYQEKT